MLEALDGAARRPAVLVVAPAGFGKSTLLADWAAALGARGAACGWFSIDPEDDEPLRFLSYFAAALGVADPHLGGRIQALLPTLRDGELGRALPLVVNGAAAREGETALFLDDVHHVRHPAIVTFLDRLLAYAPGNLRLFMASRDKTALQIQRLRLAQQVALLGIEELRFSRAEAAEFLNERRGLRLEGEHVELLCRKTEGWAAGIQLAALSLDRRIERVSFLRSFSGSDREVAEFLAHDVFLRQPEEMQEFLLTTSVLERFDAHLAAAVSGRTDADAMIRRVWDQSLFLVPLDDDRRWFRYHHLFGDFLRTRLQSRFPSRSRSLHGTAAEACLAHGHTEMALHQLLAIGEVESAAALVEGEAMRLIERGQLIALRGWLRRLPDRAFAHRPRLHLIHAWIDFHLLEPRKGMHHLRAVRRMPESAGAAAGGAARCVDPSIRDEFRTLVAGTLSAADHNRWARAFARRWLADIPPDRAFLRGTLSNILAFSCYTLGEIAEAAEAAQRGRQEHRVSGSPFGLIYADLLLALVEKARGRMASARELLQQAETVAAGLEGGYCQSLIAVFQAELAYERGGTGRAEHLLREHGHVIEGSALIVHALSGHLHLARLDVLRGRKQSALDVLGRAEKIGHVRLYRRLRAAALNEEIRLRLSAGDLAGAHAMLDRQGLLSELRQPSPELPSPAVELEQVAIARVLLSERRCAEAVRRLDPLARRMERQGRRRRLMQVLCLKALALHRLGRVRTAEDLLERVLAEGERSGFLRTIADEGQPMRPMLAALLNRRAAADDASGEGRVSVGYLQRVLAALAPLENAMPPPVAARLTEPLTAREIEIVRLLSRGCTNAALAQALALSATTVKWHLRNIYTKLGVRSRTQALLAAQTLDLVD